MPVPVFTTGEVLTAANMNAVGLWLVKSQTIGTGVTSITVANAFSTNYDNYRIHYSGGTSSVNTSATFQLQGATGLNYDTGMLYGVYGTPTPNFALSTNVYFAWTGSMGVNGNTLDMMVYSPFLSQYTYISSEFWDNNAGIGRTSGRHTINTSYTGFTIGTSSGTFTGGTIRVYGFRK